MNKDLDGRPGSGEPSIPNAALVARLRGHAMGLGEYSRFPAANRCDMTCHDCVSYGELLTEAADALETAPNAVFDPFNAVHDADERLACFVSALNGADSYDAKLELWLQAIDDSQLETDLRVLFGPASGIEAATADETALAGSAAGESPTGEAGDAQVQSQ